MNNIIFFERHDRSEIEEYLQNFNTIDEAIEASSRLFPQHVALQIWEETGHKTVTYSGLSHAIEASAEQIKQAGVHPGDRVILLLKSRSIEWVIGFFAIIKAKATAAILDELATANDLQKSVQYCDAQAILTSPHFYDLLKPQDLTPCLNIERSLQLFPDSPAKPAKKSSANDNDPSIACLIFTSGTTSQQKGVLLTHKSILYIAAQCIQYAELQEKDQVLGVLPLNHCFGLCSTIMSLLTGTTITFPDKLSGESILKAMQLSNTTLLIGAPRLLEAFYNNILQAVKSKGKVKATIFHVLAYLCGSARKRGWGNPGLTVFKSLHEKFGGHLNRIISGAAPLSRKIFHKLEQLGWTVMEGYGLTETGGAISCNTVHDHRMGTVGLPVNNAKLKISNPNMAGEGEICFQGPNLMQGYFRDPVATAQIIRDGWLHTGDLGFLDKSGWLTITGRIKEIIVAASGKKIMPADVEDRYFGIQGIQELSVLGIRSPDETHEEIHAAIVVDPAIFPPSLPAVAIHQKIKELLDVRSREVPSHLRIQHFHLLNELPKTTTFKVKRAELGKIIQTQMNSGSLQLKKPATVSQTNNDSNDIIAARILAIISQDYSGTNNSIKINTESSLQFDLCLDSINRIELADKLKKEFQLDIDDAFIFNLDKVKDIIYVITASLANKHNSSVTKSTIPLKPKPLANTLFFALFKFVSRMAWKFEAKGIENLPENSSFILCPNHETNLDLLFVSSLLPKIFRIKMGCFAKQEIFDHWFFKYFARFFNAIPVNRQGDIIPALQTAIDALNNGWNLLVNPEGTRSHDGQIGPFKLGAAYLSLNSHALLVPVRIVGAFDIFPPSRPMPRLFNWKKFRRYKIQIYFGKPLAFDAETTEVALTNQLRNAVLKLGEE